MPDGTGNIFLTTENLAFSLPLLVVCGTYVYFKFLPLEYSLPALGVVFVAFQIRSQIKARKNEKLTNLDENAIRDIVGEEEEKEKISKQEALKNAQKSRNKVKQRLAQEQKTAAKKSGGAKASKGAAAAEDDDDLGMFAKGSRAGAKKKA